jgi:hypothetical protein
LTMANSGRPDGAAAAAQQRHAAAADHRC